MSYRTRRVRSRRAVSRSKQLINSCVEMLEDRTLFAFGLTTTTNSFVVDTGANVVFSVARTTANSASRGDLTSIKYNGTDLEAPFASPQRYSHYESGLSSSTTVTASVVGNAILISCSDLTGTGVIQYYMAHQGDNNIYMAQYAPGPSSPSPGEMRFITYLNWNIFTNHPNESDTSLNESAIESTDVFHENNPPNYTHSKYYGEHRAIDSAYYGTTGSSGGNNFGAFMFIGNRETSSGGPFYKDIDFQSEGAAVELYNYTFSGHSQTENFRPGLKGPFALQLTDGSAPTPPDYSFINSLPLTGLVGPSGRGTVQGLSGAVQAGLQATVALSNAADQYWGTPDGSGNYTISGVLPGTYTETLYQGELAVGTQSVTVTAGNTTTANIADTFVTPNSIWRIGTWDGTPIGFLNADKIQNMHPSDPRMSPWVNNNFVIGTNTDADWPMAVWKNLDGTADSINTVTFNLTAQQVANMTLRIGITTAQANGRPIISTNGGSFSSAPAISPQPSTRNITVGNWRGNNFLYTYNITASSLHAGTNNIRIEVASGSSGGSQWLNPAVIYDAIELNPTIPLVPTGLVAQAVSDHEIDLVTWNAAPGATSYNVKRSLTSGGPYTTIATGVTSTSYQDPTLDPATHYFYVVSAVNGAGEGLNSSQVTAQTFAAAPTGLSATAISENEVDLDWDSDFGAASYNVYRSDASGGPYSIIATGVSGTSFGDLSVVGGHAYYYVVTSVDSGGESLMSAEASALTQPSAPTNLTAADVSTGEIDLGWDGSTGADLYTIKRSDSSGGPYSAIDTTTSTTYADLTVQGAHRYFYVVSASDSSGEGANSNEAVATTPPISANDFYTTNENATLNANDITGTNDGTNDDGVLLNDSVAPGLVLNAILVTGPQHGTLALSSDGSFLYTPAPTFAGTDTFTYKANDGVADSNISTVQITVHNTIGIILLDPSGKGALSISGNGFVDVDSGGAVIVDSSNAQAVCLSGNAQLDASAIDITGGDALSGHGHIDGSVLTGQSSVADPVAGVTAPDPSTLTVRSTSKLTVSRNQVITLNPGVYVGGIAVSGNASVTLNPGIYYMQGGGLSVSGNGKLTDLGQGVMIYNSGTTSADAINFSGNGRISLSPMTTGPWQGITIFQTRTSKTSLTVSGNGQLNVTGAIYAASAALIVTGNAGTDSSGNPLDQFGTNLILADLQVSGNGAIVI